MKVRAVNPLFGALVIIEAFVWLVQALVVLPSPFSELVSLAWLELAIAAVVILLMDRRERFRSLMLKVAGVALVGGVLTVAISLIVSLVQGTASARSPHGDLIVPALMFSLGLAALVRFFRGQHEIA